MASGLSLMAETDAHGRELEDIREGERSETWKQHEVEVGWRIRIAKLSVKCSKLRYLQVLGLCGKQGEAFNPSDPQTFTYRM